MGGWAGHWGKTMSGVVGTVVMVSPLPNSLFHCALAFDQSVNNTEHFCLKNTYLLFYLLNEIGSAV